MASRNRREARGRGKHQTCIVHRNKKIAFGTWSTIALGKSPYLFETGKIVRKPACFNCIWERRALRDSTIIMSRPCADWPCLEFKRHHRVTSIHTIHRGAELGWGSSQETSASAGKDCPLRGTYGHYGFEGFAPCGKTKPHTTTNARAISISVCRSVGLIGGPQVAGIAAGIFLEVFLGLGVSGTGTFGWCSVIGFRGFLTVCHVAP